MFGQPGKEASYFIDALEDSDLLLIDATVKGFDGDVVVSDDVRLDLVVELKKVEVEATVAG